MKKKLNKKLLNLIALCSGLTATVTLGVGGVVYSLRQEKDGGDEPIYQDFLPDEVYEINSDNVLIGFKDQFLNDPTSKIYKDNFKNCHTMQIPTRVTSINENAFFNGSESTIPDFIENLTFAEGSKCSSFGIRSFESSTLNHIDFSNATILSSIGSSAFADCSALTSVDFSNATSLSTIGDNAFSFCAQITSIDLSNCNSLSSIGQHVFENCSALTSITFPSSLKEIGSLTFTLCLQLNSITWDAWKGDTSLPESDAFAGVCPDGGTVTVTNPSDNTHDSIALLEYLLNNGGLPESWRPAPELPDDVYIIENNVLKGFTNEFLANPSAYRLCDTMRIPARVTSVDTTAFFNGEESTIPSFIKKLTFAESSQCVSIGECAFMGCFSTIASVDLSNCNDLNSIGEGAFYFCSSMTSVKLPKSLEKIEELAFSYCDSLKSINLSDLTNLCLIGENTFNSCSQLTLVNLSNCNNLLSIGNHAFENCSSLTTVDFSNCLNLPLIGEYTFRNCSKLTSVDFSNCSALTSIGICPFENCSSLTTVDFSNCSSLTSINPCAFENCSSLTTVDFSNCSNLIEIGGEAFYECWSLSSVDLSKCTYLSSINQSAFQNCSALTSIDLPASLNSIGGDVFRGCSSLNSITWDAWNGNTALNIYTFSGVCPDGGTVTVTNPIDDAHDSIALLEYLLNNGGLPESWRIDRVLPKDVFEIDENNVFNGFKDEFLNDPTSPIYKDNYENCNTLEIPANVEKISSYTFHDVPSFLTKLTFAEGSKCDLIPSGAFTDWPSLISADLSNLIGETTLPGSVFIDCLSLASVTFPKNIKNIANTFFQNCPLVNHIAWDLPNDYETSVTISNAVFANISSTGTVKSLNPSITSQQLLEFLQTKGGLPTTGWTAE